jgi:hypothetical protein
MKHYYLQTDGRVKLSVLHMLNAALDEAEQSASRTGPFIVDESPVVPTGQQAGP